jgi:hypothetical protein
MNSHAKKNLMKSVFRNILINLSLGIIAIGFSWLITFENNFIFGLITPVLILAIMIVFYYLTNKYTWIISIPGFFVSLYLAGYVVENFVKNFPDWNLVDEEYFPNSGYFILIVFIWVVCKLLVDLVLNILVNEKYKRKSIIEKRIFKNND